MRFFFSFFVWPHKANTKSRKVLACVTGVIGEGGGVGARKKLERKKEGLGGPPLFSRFFSPPPPLPHVTPATQGYKLQITTHLIFWGRKYFSILRFQKVAKGYS